MVSAREIYSCFNTTERFSKWFNRNKSGFIENKDYFRYPSRLFIQKEGDRLIKRKMIDYNLTLPMSISIILQLSKHFKINNKLQDFINTHEKNIKCMFYTIPRKEIIFLNALEQSLKPLDIVGVRQYKVLNYRIDYYIPSINVAIEYDENNHKYYTYEEHEQRQYDIKNKLNCTFIRVSDLHDDYYNIGLIISQISKFINI